MTTLVVHGGAAGGLHTVKMSEYSGFGSSYGSRGTAGAPDKGRIMEQVRNQVALASAQEMIQVNIRSKPLVKCIQGQIYRCVVLRQLYLCKLCVEFSHKQCFQIMNKTIDL